MGNLLTLPSFIQLFIVFLNKVKYLKTNDVLIGGNY